MKALLTAMMLSWAYLRQRPLATLLNVLLLGLGLGTIIALVLTLAQAEARMERDTAGVDLVIGAKGSPLQLVLSSVFQIDVPTGNVPLAEAAAIIAAPQVKLAVPLALGDSFRNFRIVGTEPGYADLYGATLRQGRFWTKPMEVVVGAGVGTRAGTRAGTGTGTGLNTDAARFNHLHIGENFVGSHGVVDGGSAHADRPYTVVGVLNPTGTVIDQLILTSVESAWVVHGNHDEDEAGHGQDVAQEKGQQNGNDRKQDTEHHDDKEITAYLIQYASPLAAASFPRLVNASSSLQAASPAMETARLFALLGVGVSTLKIFASIMMICAALGIFIGLSNALNEQRADLALLRLLGATPATVFFTVALQGITLGLLGVILGILLGHSGAEWMGIAIQKTHRIQLTGWVFFKEEITIAAAALLLAVLAALPPAWRAHCSAVPETLNNA